MRPPKAAETRSMVVDAKRGSISEGSREMREGSD